MAPTSMAGDIAEAAGGRAAGHRYRTRQVNGAARSDRGEGRAAFEALLREADVVVQGYRPGGLAALASARRTPRVFRPGIVYVSLCAYSHEGRGRAPRLDSLVQTASGFNAAEAEAADVDGPKPLPAQVLDHASGYLLAYGAMTALLRQRRDGGSWQVRVSLAQTGYWLRSLGRVADGLRCKDPALDDVRDCLEESASGFGKLSAVRHPATLSETPPRWARPSVPLGTHPPHWL